MSIDISGSTLASHSPMPPHLNVHSQESVSEHASSVGIPKVEIQHTVTQMNSLSAVMNHRMTYSLDHDTNDVIVKVIDADTDKVIREMPAVELQKLHRSIKDAVGLLINKLI